MKLDERDLIILGYFEDDPDSLKPLFKKVKRSTAYYRIRKLVNAGYLGKRGKRYVLLPLGREALAASRSVPLPTSPEPTILKAIPQIALGPTSVHRSILVLICAAIVARKHRICDSHHPTFLPFGPKLTWKTWTAKMACRIVGIDPDRHVLDMASETPGALIVRRDASGNIATRRAAVTQPVVGLDEIGRAKSEVLRAFKVLSRGEIKTSFENEILEITCVPIATMNPKSEGLSSDLTELLQLDEGTLRRCVPVDLGKVVLSSEVLTEGDSRLARAQTMGPADFPAPAHPGWLPSTEVQHYLEKAFDNAARSADVDFTMVAMLCTALTAWLSRRDALHLGVKCYLELVETLGWLKPDWRACLPPTGDVDTPDDQAAMPAEHPPTRSRPNPLDHTEKLNTMVGACNRLQITAEDGADLILRVRELGISKLAALEALNKDLTERGLDLDRLGEILTIAESLADERQGSKAGALALLRQLLDVAQNTFPEDLSVDESRSALEAVSDSAAVVGRLREEARDLELKIRDSEDRNEAAADQHKSERDRLKKTRAAQRQAESDLNRTQRTARDLQAKSRKCARTSALAKAVLLLFKGELDPYGPFAQELASWLKARREGRLLGGPVTLSDSAKWEIHNRFFSKLAGGYVPQAKVEEFKHEAQRTAEKGLRCELSDVLEVLRDSEKTPVEKQAAIESAINTIG